MKNSKKYPLLMLTTYFDTAFIVNIVNIFFVTFYYGTPVAYAPSRMSTIVSNTVKSFPNTMILPVSLNIIL